MGPCLRLLVSQMWDLGLERTSVVWSTPTSDFFPYSRHGLFGAIQKGICILQVIKPNNFIQPVFRDILPLSVLNLWVYHVGRRDVRLLRSGCCARTQAPRPATRNAPIFMTLMKKNIPVSMPCWQLTGAVGVLLLIYWKAQSNERLCSMPTLCPRG